MDGRKNTGFWNVYLTTFININATAWGTNVQDSDCVDGANNYFIQIPENGLYRIRVQSLFFLSDATSGSSQLTCYARLVKGALAGAPTLIKGATAWAYTLLTETSTVNDLRHMTPLIIDVIVPCLKDEEIRLQAYKSTDTSGAQIYSDVANGWMTSSMGWEKLD
jgi:hypothetical protein